MFMRNIVASISSARVYVNTRVRAHPYPLRKNWETEKDRERERDQKNSDIADDHSEIGHAFLFLSSSNQICERKRTMMTTRDRCAHTRLFMRTRSTCGGERKPRSRLNSGIPPPCLPAKYWCSSSLDRAARKDESVSILFFKYDRTRGNRSYSETPLLRIIQSRLNHHFCTYRKLRFSTNSIIARLRVKHLAGSSILRDSWPSLKAIFFTNRCYDCYGRETF